MARVVAAALILGAAGAAWAGLGWLVMNAAPSRPLAILAAYVFGFAAITSTGAFLAWLAFGRNSGSPAGYMAHSMLLAIIILFALWLQTLRTLTPIVVILLIGFVVFPEFAGGFAHPGP